MAAIDLHAHSTGTSSFIYGNEKADMANMQAQVRVGVGLGGLGSQSKFRPESCPMVKCMCSEN